MRRPPRIAFYVSWVVFAVAVFLSWRKVLAVPQGRGDINSLVVATMAGALGLALLGDYVRRKDSEKTRRASGPEPRG